MRKRKKGKKFSRKRDQRRALLRSLIRELFLKERIKLSEVRAKEISIFSEKLITKAKKGNLHSRRQLAKNLSPALTKKLIEEISPRYKERKGGYTRIIKLGPRKSDGTKMAIIELIK
jgi:large subunit ribosomal protein L17